MGGAKNYFLSSTLFEVTESQRKQAEKFMNNQKKQSQGLEEQQE